MSCDRDYGHKIRGHCYTADDIDELKGFTNPL